MTRCGALRQRLRELAGSVAGSTIDGRLTPRARGARRLTARSCCGPTGRRP